MLNQQLWQLMWQPRHTPRPLSHSLGARRQGPSLTRHHTRLWGMTSVAEHTASRLSRALDTRQVGQHRRQLEAVSTGCRCQ